MKQYSFLRIYLLLFCMGMAMNSYSQLSPQQIRFRHLTGDDGLPNNTVRCILQDKLGFIWFGTDDGLARYDGYNFKVFADTTVESDKSVRCMVEDDRGKIWTGNRRSGLYVFDPKTGKFKHYSYDKNDTTSLIWNDVISLCKDKDGDIWVGTNRGLNLYDKKNDDFIRYDSLPNSPGTLFELFVDSKNMLWLGSHYQGLNSFDKKTKSFTRYSEMMPPLSAWFDKSRWYYEAVAISEDKNGLLWVSTRSGLALFDPSQKKFIAFYRPKQDDPLTISGGDMFLSKQLIDSKGQLWIGTTETGLNIYNREQDNFTRLQYNMNYPYSISDNAIRKIYEDESGMIWVGTHNRGVNIFDYKTAGFICYSAIANTPGTLSSNIITAVYEDSKGRLWVGVQNAGVDMLDTKTGKFTNYMHLEENKNTLSGNNIGDICEDKDGRIWASATFGINYFDEKAKKFKYETGGRIYYLYTDKEGKIWAGEHGAYIYDFKTKKWINYPDTLSHSKGMTYIEAVYHDNEDNIWFGSSNFGLTIYSPKTKQFVNYQNNISDSTTISHNIINSIHQDKKGAIWVGTMHGLNALNPKTGKFKRYFKRDGLPDDEIRGILEDNERNLWLATTKGLCKFNPQKNTFRTFDITDGLPGNDFTRAACKGKDGKFYFGTANGLVAFYPEKLSDNTHKPPVAITKFAVLNKPWELQEDISYTKEITLSYREYFFSFEFAALDFSAPEKNQYAYKMEGFNKDWVELGNKREVTFTNLDHGEYVFRVKGSNNHGYWNEKGASVKIIITPPWWKTKTFYASCIIAVILLIYTYIKWRERKLKKEKRVLQEKVIVATSEIRKQKEIIEAKNKDITDSIHYAENIQHAILPPIEDIKKVLPESFILFKPKDIVSGDFYFFSVIAREEAPKTSLRGSQRSEGTKQSDSAKEIASSRFKAGLAMTGGAARNDVVIIAACDSTGHGVPGAFMSMLGSQMLNEIVNDNSVTDAAEVLNQLRKGIIHAFGEAGARGAQKDGMDMALCVFNMKTNQLQYAGANNPLYIIHPVIPGEARNPLDNATTKGEEPNSSINELTEIKPDLSAETSNHNYKLYEVKADKQPIGYTAGEQKPFTNNDIKLEKGDTIYMSSDGYQDQFGGEVGKKFMRKQFKHLLLEIHGMGMEEQKEHLNKTIEEWKGSGEQVDDILVIGVKV